MAEPTGIHEGVTLRPADTPLLGPDAEKALKIAELGAGMRCVGCGERIEMGLRFTQFKAVLRRGKPHVERSTVTACSRKDCNYAQECAPLADVMEMVEFAWLSETKSLGGEPEDSARRGRVATAKRAGRVSRADRRVRAAAAR